MTAILDRTLILSAYKKAEKRILFLDYDGTLVPFNDLPEDSVMGDNVRSIIMNLTKDPKNRIYIISGRDKEFLANQFSGINTGLIAEHGFLVKEPKEDWMITVELDNTWRKEVHLLFSEFTVLYPGTFIEEKESSVAYHYRTAEKKAGPMVRPAIRKKFLILEQKFPGLELLDGDKVVEIKPGNFNKGLTAGTIIRNGNYDFIMAAGDDLTDECLFSELDKVSYTIKVGLQPTRARYYVANQEQFISFLGELISEEGRVKNEE